MDKKYLIFRYLKLFLSLTHKGHHPKEEAKMLPQLQPAQGSTVWESKSVQISNRLRRINHSQVQGEIPYHLIWIVLAKNET